LQLGQKFSTLDKDTVNKCAFKFTGGWWYQPKNNCHHSHLTGLYLFGKHQETYKSVLWLTFRKVGYSLKFAQMKIRPFHI